MAAFSRSHSGFTIVELLIVIVVVAILATIAIFAYNGMSQRAIIAHYASAVNAYDKAIRLNKARTGTYISGSGFSTCLGTASDYPATADFPAGVCTVDASTGTVYTKIESSFVNETLISSSLPGLPQPLIPVTAYGSKWRGVWVNFSSSSADYFEIEMVLPRSMPCPSNMRQYDSVEENVHWCERDG